MKTTYIVQVFLNEIFTNFQTGKIVSSFDDEWVRRRIMLFEKTTLRSLRSQTFKDFQIWMLCSERNQDPILEHVWPPDVRICFDKGREALEDIDTDYLSITRIDSDDLFHKRAMADIVANQKRTDKRECLIFRKNLEWDRPNRFIHPQVRPSPPFFTHIFPWSIFDNWEEYKVQHFLDHGQAGGRLRGTIELPANRACVVKHGENHRYKRRRKNLRIYTPVEIRKFVGTDGFIFDKERIADILEDFAVPREEVLEDWQ